MTAFEASKLPGEDPTSHFCHENEFVCLLKHIYTHFDSTKRLPSVTIIWCKTDIMQGWPAHPAMVDWSCFTPYSIFRNLICCLFYTYIEKIQMSFFFDNGGLVYKLHYLLLSKEEIWAVNFFSTLCTCSVFPYWYVFCQFFFWCHVTPIHTHPFLYVNKSNFLFQGFTWMFSFCNKHLLYYIFFHKIPMPHPTEMMACL